VLLLKHGVLAAMATEHVLATDVIDTKAHRADITIPERFQLFLAVYTLYVQEEYFLAVLLIVQDVRDALAMSTDLI
jgi:hypothetical protein